MDLRHVALLWRHGDGDGQRTDVVGAAGPGAPAKRGIRGPGGSCEVAELLKINEGEERQVGARLGGEEA